MCYTIEGVFVLEPNKENIKKWVEALESGEFKQTTGCLENSDGNCCLGVACRVAMENGVPISIIDETSPDGCDGASTLFDGASGYLPNSVQTWLGLSNSNPRFVYGSEFFHAGFLNDNMCLSFCQIAQCIRNTYLTEENQ